jgi:hypothetical protein
MGNFYIRLSNINRMIVNCDAVDSNQSSLNEWSVIEFKLSAISTPLRLSAMHGQGSMDMDVVIDC